MMKASHVENSPLRKLREQFSVSRPKASARIASPKIVNQITGLVIVKFPQFKKNATHEIAWYLTKFLKKNKSPKIL